MIIIQQINAKPFSFEGGEGITITKPLLDIFQSSEEEDKEREDEEFDVVP